MLLQLALLSAAVHQATACGGFFCAPQQPVVQSGESIIFGVEGNKIAMHVLINYEGPSEEFSWLVPLMYEPTLATGSFVYFESMFQTTLPQFQFSVDEDASSCEPLLCEEPPLFFGTTAIPDLEDGDNASAGLTVKRGEVGPFNTIILYSPSHNVNEVTNWLADNGYDEYTGSRDILAHYVESGHYFVALELKNDADSGDLVPIVLEYEVDNIDSFACVPIQLTRVAVTDNLPIQVYILADRKVDPINYFRVELDDTKVDWINCQGNPSCYDQDYRERAAAGFLEIDGHGFVEEYAGTARVMDDQIKLDITENDLAESGSVSDFMQLLRNANVPAGAFMDGIVNEFIPLEFKEGATNGCDTLTSLYADAQNSFFVSNCADQLANPSPDLVGLAAAIQEKVIAPAEKAQSYTDSFPYLTRLYVNMLRKDMTKDPFFNISVAEGVGDRSNVHSATGVPICNDGDDLIEEMEITLEDGTKFTSPIEFSCGWIRPQDQPLYGTNSSTIKTLVVNPYGDESESLILRNSGTFRSTDIAAAKDQMDGRVMDQTISPVPPTPMPQAAAPAPTAATPTSGCDFGTLWARVYFLASVLAFN